jgi:hypothetical protein
MEASKALRELSQPQMRGEKTGAIIDRCARLAGLSYYRAYEIYYGRARRIEPEEIARISEALKQKNSKDARNELSELRLRLTRLETILVLSDEGFHRENLGPVRDALRRSR